MRIQTMLTGGELDEISERLPADTPGMLAVRGAAELFLEFGSALPGNKDLPSIVTEDLAAIRTQLSKYLGFDPLTREGWESTGLDFFRPAGLSIDSMDPENSTTRLLLPVSDENALKEFIEHLLTHASIPYQQTLILERPAWTITSQVGLVLDGDQLLGISSAESGFSPEEALTEWLSVPPTDSLANAPGFQRTVEGLGDNWQALAYASSGLMATLKEQALAKLPGSVAWAEYLPIESGYTLHLDNNRARARYGALLPKPPPPFFLEGASSLGHKISGDALLTGRVGLDLPTWLQQIQSNKEMQNALDYALALGSGFVGANLHTEGLENLTGRFSMAILEPLDATRNPLDAVSWFELKDTTESVNLVKRLCAAGEAMMGLQGVTDVAEAATWCQSEFMGLGISEGHFVFAAGAGRATSVLTTINAEDSPSHLDPLPASVQAGLDSDDVLHFWLDVRGLSPLSGEEVIPRRVRAWVEGLAPEVLEEHLPMSGLSGGINLSPDFALAEVTLHAPAEGFSTWLSQAKGHIQALATAPRTAPPPPTDIQLSPVPENDTNPAEEALLAAAEQEVTELRTAVLEYSETFGPPANCSSEQSARTGLAEGREVDWKTLDCFTEIGWMPSGRFVLWLVVDGESFGVHALVDSDKDGDPAHLLATQHTPTHRASRKDVR